MATSAARYQWFDRFSPRSLKANPPIPNPYKLLCPVKANTHHGHLGHFIVKSRRLTASKTVNPFCLAH